MRAYLRLSVLALMAIVMAGCGPTVDLAKALKVSVASTGWFDAGIVNGKNKLVPMIVLTVTNQSDQTLVSLQLNAVFRRVTEKEEWDSGFVIAAGSSGLAPGATTPTLTIKSRLGYTGSDQSRQELLENKQFIDAKVELFGKYGSVQWTRLGEYPVTRRLVEP